MARDGRPATALELERRRQGYSQELLAMAVTKETGHELAQHRVSLLERGVWPSLAERKALAKTLGVSETYIFPPVVYSPPAPYCEGTQQE